MTISRLLSKSYRKIRKRIVGREPHSIDEAWIRSQQAVFEKRYPAEFERDRANADLLVLSFPKAGRTWHRAIAGYYLARLVGESPQVAFDLPRLCAATGISRMVYSHNGANFMDWLSPDNPLIASPALWEGMPVVLLVREPKDILVSAYHHAQYRSNLFDGTLSEFIREPRTGIEKIMTAWNRWYENRHLARSFDVTSYESMHREPEKDLSTFLQMAGVRDVDPTLLAEAVEFCRFDNMKEKETSKFFQTSLLGATKSGDDRSRKVREGRIGGHKKYLTEEDEAYVDDFCRRVGNPFEAYLSA